MIGAAETATIHQLLGRMVYFHALFIEPAQPPRTPGQVGKRCCNHGAAPAQRPADELLAGTAWTAVVEVAATLPPYWRPCPETGGTCCDTCLVLSAATAIATGWADTEWWSYYRGSPAGSLIDCIGRTAASRLGRVFADQHNTRCRGLDRLVALDLGADPLPGPEEIPLTAELLSLWARPTATTSHPVTGWLNHCTGLADIRRVLETRRARW